MQQEVDARRTTTTCPQVLHYLETLQPAALFTQLFGMAVSSAVALLSASQGAALPAVQGVLAQFKRLAGARCAHTAC
jgi:hypothetical protein